MSASKIWPVFTSKVVVVSAIVVASLFDQQLFGSPAMAPPHVPLRKITRLRPSLPNAGVPLVSSPAKSKRRLEHDRLFQVSKLARTRASAPAAPQFPW